MGDGYYTDAQNLRGGFNSFSGADIHTTFAGTRIGTLQGISFTVTREKAPIYTMGRADPRGFSRGKRGIAGSLIFAVFDRSNLLEALEDNFLRFAASKEDISAGSQKRGNRVPILGANLLESNSPGVKDIGIPSSMAFSWYHDQIPPFDVVMVAKNEYGSMARMEIKGIEILNAGSGVSIDDIITDENMTFVARTIIPWHALGTVANSYVQRYNKETYNA